MLGDRAAEVTEKRSATISSISGAVASSSAMRRSICSR
jgi:hypothetical protein